MVERQKVMFFIFLCCMFMCIQAQEHQKTFIVHTDFKWFPCWLFLCVCVSRGSCCFKSCFFFQDIVWISWQLTHSDLLPSSQHTDGTLHRLSAGEGERGKDGCSCYSFSWKFRFLLRPNFTPCKQKPQGGFEPLVSVSAGGMYFTRRAVHTPCCSHPTFIKSAAGLTQTGFGLAAGIVAYITHIKPGFSTATLSRVDLTHSGKTTLTFRQVFSCRFLSPTRASGVNSRSCGVVALWCSAPLDICIRGV